MPDLNQLNQYGVPLHACNGYRCDEHVWAYIRHLTNTSDAPLYVWLRQLRDETV